MATDLTAILALPRVSVEHIAVDEKGVARLAGHRIKVKHLVEVMRAQGYTAEQIQSEAYPHLSLAQIYAGLAYYYDHQQQIDQQIQEDCEFAEHERKKQESDPRYCELTAKIKQRWAARDQE